MSLTEKENIPVLPPGTRIEFLKNGLAIIVREDRSAPVVSAQVWCRAGSIHEGKWLGAGLSHVLEHMLFKGTKTRPGSRIDQEVQDVGGYMNAYTSFDRTVYYINVPSDGAKVAIDILCDIAQNATLPEDEMVKELDVIRREMDMGDDDPGRTSGRRLFEVAYTTSPYRHTIIGYPDIFNKITRQDVLDYYTSKYSPNNLFYVVAGDVNADEVIAQIRDSFKEIPLRAMPPAYLPPEPNQSAPREVIEESAIELGHLHYSWHIPDVRHADVPALDVLAVILGNGYSSRLYQEIREKAGIVHSVDAWTYNPGLPGLFGMSAIFEADDFEPVMAALLKEIENVRSEPVDDHELRKAVNQFVAATLGTRKTMSGQAQDLGGNWLAASDLNFSARYLAAVKRLTPADLQRVADIYLTEENRTLYALLPEGKRPTIQLSTEQKIDRPVEKIELPNGLRLLVKEDHRLPFVNFRFAFQGGVLTEDSQTNGLSHLLSKCMIKGTAKRTAAEIAVEMESIGGHIDCYSGNNSFGASAEVLSTDFAHGLEVLADVILNPAFSDDAIQREREVQLASIRARRDDLLPSAGLLMRKTLFDGEGYGRDQLGTEESVSGITREQVQAQHRKLTVPNNGVLSIFGDVKAADVKAAVEKHFGSWKPNADVKPGAVTFPHFIPASAQHVSDQRDKKQAVLVVGFPGLSMFDEDRPALDLIQESCSDLGSRLFMRIRDDLGLAYYVGAHNFVGLIPGYFSFYVGTSPESAKQCEEEIMKEVAALREGGLSEIELKRSKAKVIGHRKIHRQDLGNLAINTALDELYGLGFHHHDEEDARYAAVTLEDTKRIARKILDPTHAVVAIIAPES
jgi:zinc protease